jgi:hypothetical protein
MLVVTGLTSTLIDILCLNTLMAIYSFSENFKAFFSRLNPSGTFELTASSEYNAAKDLLENTPSVLSPTCFLQGSYRQQTAIYTINDVDIVALCRLWFPAPATAGMAGGTQYSRNQIFDLVAAPLRKSPRYAGKVHYNATSMCIKLDLKIPVEILPVVYKGGNYDPAVEPFVLHRPETGKWEDGFARNHQRLLSAKNSEARTGGNFIPAVKILKHLRSYHKTAAVSFHLESLLYRLEDNLFLGGPADYIPSILSRVAGLAVDKWYAWKCMTPSGDRDIFTASEWNADSWWTFYRLVSALAPLAEGARSSETRATAVARWQQVLGSDFFPGYL